MRRYFNDSDSDLEEGDEEAAVKERIAREYGFARQTANEEGGEGEGEGEDEEDDPLDAFMAGIEVRRAAWRLSCNTCVQSDCYSGGLCKSLTNKVCI